MWKSSTSFMHISMSSDYYYKKYLTWSPFIEKIYKEDWITCKFLAQCGQLIFFTGNTQKNSDILWIMDVNSLK